MLGRHECARSQHAPKMPSIEPEVNRPRGKGVPVGLVSRGGVRLVGRQVAVLGGGQQHSILGEVRQLRRLPRRRDHAPNCVSAPCAQPSGTQTSRMSLSKNLSGQGDPFNSGISPVTGIPSKQDPLQ